MDPAPSNFLAREPSVMPFGTRLKVEIVDENSVRLRPVDPTRLEFLSDRVNSLALFGTIFEDTQYIRIPKVISQASTSIVVERAKGYNLLTISGKQLSQEVHEIPKQIRKTAFCNLLRGINSLNQEKRYVFGDYNLAGYFFDPQTVNLWVIDPGNGETGGEFSNLTSETAIQLELHLMFQKPGGMKELYERLGLDDQMTFAGL